jgi:hypothetical protein
MFNIIKNLLILIFFKKNKGIIDSNSNKENEKRVLAYIQLNKLLMAFINNVK